MIKPDAREGLSRKRLKDWRFLHSRDPLRVMGPYPMGGHPRHPVSRPAPDQNGTRRWRGDAECGATREGQGEEGGDGSEIRRELSAIFAADVKGYSRLMELDEVGTLRTLTAYRVIIDRLITSHRGRIFNTAGDRRQVRSRLAAGGRWIRTSGTAAQKPWIPAAFRALRGSAGLLNGTT
jgi:hypothetical protein